MSMGSFAAGNVDYVRRPFVANIKPGHRVLCAAFVLEDEQAGDDLRAGALDEDLALQRLGRGYLGRDLDRGRGVGLGRGGHGGQLAAAVVARLTALRGPGESYSDVILRLAKVSLASGLGG